MHQRQTIWRSLRFDFIFLGILILGVALYTFLSEPYNQEADEITSPGSRPPDRTEGDVLLLLPDVPSAHALSFSELDCSYGWFNALWQEYGSFASAMTRNLSPEILAGRSVVIVPRRVAEVMPSTGVRALATFVQEGGQVIIEQPNKGWEQVTGLSPPKKTRKAQRISSTDGLGVHGPMRKHLPKVPLIGNLQITPRQDAWPNGPTLVEIDGHPGIMQRQLGEGYVFTLLFDMGCTTTGLQQGLPTQGMRFGGAQLSPTSTRMADESLARARVPFSDLLERAIFERLSLKRPIPRLWSYPGKHAGALVVSHPTPYNTRAALGYAEWSRKQGGVSTVFAATDRLDATQIKLLDESSAHLGLLWVRGISRPQIVEPIGIGSLEPLRRELSLYEQFEQFHALTKASGTPVVIARAEHGMWDADFDTTFKIMANAQVRMDNSFGPSEPDQHGYLFGTGFPFYPIDDRGLPLPLLELPNLFYEASLTRDLLDQFLTNSRSFFHQVITISISSHAMRTRPSAGALLGLRDAHTLATEHNHWVATQRELLEFNYARRQSVLTSQWSERNRRLTLSVNLLETKPQMIPQGAVPGVAVPRTWGGEEIEKVVVNDTELPLKLLATSGPSTERIIELPKGRHSISVYYAAPATPEPVE